MSRTVTSSRRVDAVAHGGSIDATGNWVRSGRRTKQSWSIRPFCRSRLPSSRGTRHCLQHLRWRNHSTPLKGVGGGAVLQRIAAERREEAEAVNRPPLGPLRHIDAIFAPLRRSA